MHRWQWTAILLVCGLQHREYELRDNFSITSFIYSKRESPTSTQSFHKRSSPENSVSNQAQAADDTNGPKRESGVVGNKVVSLKGEGERHPA